MNKKKKLFEIDQKLSKPLPQIKKGARSTHNSPRNLINSSLPSSPPNIPKLPEELFIKRLEDKPKQNIFTCHSTPGITPYPKPELISPEHSKASSIENEIPVHNFVDYMQGTVSSLNKRLELEFKRDSKKKTRFNDQDLLSLNQIIQEQQDYIDTLITEMNTLKVKTKSLEDANSKIVINWQMSESNSKSYFNLLKSTESKLKEVQSDAEYKQGELLELQEMLQKSENKRRAANEQMNDFESKLVLFQRQVSKLTTKNLSIEEELKSLKLLIQEKESHINSLISQLSALESSLETEKLNHMQEIIQLNQSKESLLSQIEELKVVKEKVESENERLIGVVNEFMIEKQKTPQVAIARRSETWADHKFITEMTREEATRWHSRYFALEEEIQLLKQQLEKYSKNDAYYKNQIAQKNSFIEKLEILIQNIETKTSESPQYKKEASGNLEFFMKALGEMIKNAKETLSCANCFRGLQKGFLCVPCGHVVCESCCEACLAMCGNCAEKVEGLRKVPVIERLSDIFDRHMRGLEKLLDIINFDG